MLAEFGSLQGFLKAAKGRSQQDIIIEFLAATVIADPVAEQGSVLIDNPRKQKLMVFNEGDFLFQRRFLDPQARGSWRTEFDYYEGVAGLCYRTKSTQVFPKNNNVAVEFLGGSPIQNMVCIPIMTGGSEPFGVVCFHNNEAEREFVEKDVAALESYVDVLAIALHNPLPELNVERNVFIVHGHDKKSLNDLQLILWENKVTPRVLVREDKGPNSLLEELEALLRVCKAGFILVTPDDEGRLQDVNEPLSPRARENVIFETGLLFAKYREFERVAILLKAPTRLPSDLNGIAFLSFDNVKDIEAPIVKKLEKWGLKA